MTNNRIKDFIDIILELGKVKITIFVSFSTFIGYVLSKGSVDLFVLKPILGVFFLAVSASALNHLQEKEFDKVMERTKGRPLPSGKVSVLFVVVFILLFFILGTLILLNVDLNALLLGWLTFFWYNGVYTPLKKKIALAVVPGSLIGAFPPLIGWVSAGGDISNPTGLALALAFFIWQIPHFWLLLLLYDKEYKQAGYPTLTDLFNNEQLKRISFVWILSLFTSSLFIPLFNFPKNLIATGLIIIMGVWLVYNSKSLLLKNFDKNNIRNNFMKLNIYVLLVVLILFIDKLYLQSI